MKPTDAVLSTMPEQFRLTRSTARTAIFATLAAAALIGLVLAVVEFDAIVVDSSDMTGRRAGMSGLVAPGTVVLTAFFAFLFGWLAISGSYTWQLLPSGAPLSRRVFRIDCDAETAGRWHAAFASGDPAQYLPIGSHKKGETFVGIFVSTDEQVAFVTVAHGTGASTRTWPLITLRDRAYVQLKSLATADFGRPAQRGAAGSIDPFLRG
ncbi:hypothetical protein LQ757_05045 [Agromyces sp. SYSU K20354]|uniref:hypothetical protein n=1 Tax=Agromyces cavernae TaxID=2898659 RepID=UPI001E4C0DCA|nr:hypothetical protein [Agromyces cavernae]MCD2441639.1 hypothetical protein [Agromyces cavernae]